MNVGFTFGQLAQRTAPLPEFVILQFGQGSFFITKMEEIILTGSESQQELLDNAKISADYLRCVEPEGVA